MTAFKDPEKMAHELALEFVRIRDRGVGPDPKTGITAIAKDDFSATYSEAVERFLNDLTGSDRKK